MVWDFTQHIYNNCDLGDYLKDNNRSKKIYLFLNTSITKLKKTCKLKSFYPSFLCLLKYLSYTHEISVLGLFSATFTFHNVTRPCVQIPAIVTILPSFSFGCLL